MLISIAQTAGVTVAQVRVESLDGGNSGEARRLLKDLLMPGARVVFDLGRLDLVDASGLALLVWFIREAQARQAQVCFCNLSRPLRAYFEMLNLHNLIPVYETGEEALLALHQAESASGEPALVMSGRA